MREYHSEYTPYLKIIDIDISEFTINEYDSS